MLRNLIRVHDLLKQYPTFYGKANQCLILFLKIRKKNQRKGMLPQGNTVQ